MSGRIHIYKWNGSAWHQEASIGSADLGSGMAIGNFGDINIDVVGILAKTKGSMAIYGVADNGTGVYGASPAGNGIGVEGYSLNGVGGIFTGPVVSPLRLMPSNSSAAPTHSAPRGCLWVTSYGVLYINTDSSTTWQKVGAQ